jgi:predicted HAD superfamily Cof-like phosphohydrolase
MPEAEPRRGRLPTERRTSPAAAVHEFHRALNLPIRDVPTSAIPTPERELRIRLIAEEAREFAEASAAHDLVEIADALADLVYVTYGAALQYGIDLDAVVAEVHRANMSKVDRRGDATMRADGKVLKGPSYRAPGLDDILGVQRAEVVEDGSTQLAWW